MKQKILQQGAEAIIIQKENKVIKNRIKKSYRISQLDERIRKLRTRSEAKLLERASKVISIPKVIKVDEPNKKIVMEFIKGKKLSEHLDTFHLKKQKSICKQVGKDVAKLHDSNIIHGDLTTSNMIYREDGETKIFFIDFGLGFISHKYEDKAVDIHLFKQALESRHFKNWETLFKEFLKGYKISKDYEKTLNQLNKVEKRGRYKH